MPREKISNHPGDEARVEVGWQRDGDAVQVVTATDAGEGSAVSCWLSAAALDRLIRTAQKARRQAFGEPVASEAEPTLAGQIRAQMVPCPDHPLPLPKPSCWQCPRNGAFERAARIADGTHGTPPAVCGGKVGHVTCPACRQVVPVEVTGPWPETIDDQVTGALAAVIAQHPDHDGGVTLPDQRWTPVHLAEFRKRCGASASFSSGQITA